MKYSLFFLVLLFFSFQIFAERNVIDIWSGVKNVKSDTKMFVSKPSNANGTAVIICPGGSYHHLGMYSEGHLSAKWFNSIGVTTFVLRYRVAQVGYHHPSQLEDIQRAIQLIRENASVYGIEKNKIGAIGFSAGGHLVTMAATFAKTDNELAKYGIDVSVSLAPDFIMPIYPVISMRDDIVNTWSRKSLLHKDMSDERKYKFSLENQIHYEMPPTYIVACEDDKVVNIKNSQLLYEALLEKNIICKFVRYETGGHGFGMKNNAFMKKYKWNEDLKLWLEDIGML